jgi:hypothetical protein
MGIPMIWFTHVVWHMIDLSFAALRAQQIAKAQIPDISEAGRLIKRVSVDLSLLKGDLQSLYPTSHALSFLPGIGVYLDQVEPAVNLVTDLSLGGDLVFQSFSPLFAQNKAQEISNQPMSEQLVQVVDTHKEQLNAANRYLSSAIASYKTINKSLFPEKYKDILSKIDQNISYAQVGVDLIPFLAELLGVNGSQTYLILAQNNDELRATGGFISGIGKVSIDRGKISDFAIHDSYAVDDLSKPYPSPPEPIQRIMLAAMWVARDGNWSPDFPTSAVNVQQLYTLSTGEETQGVIAFDQEAVKAILKVTGPVRIGDYPNPISAETVEAFMRISWSPNPETGKTQEWWLNRKNFMGDLGKVLVNRLMGIKDLKMVILLAKELMDTIKAGHISIYLNNDRIQDILSKGEMDGGVHPTDGDFLLLVDSNVGFNKTDAVVRRSLDYEVDLRSLDSPKAKVTVHYTHTIRQQVECKHEATYGKGDYSDMFSRCYWDYWRIYKTAGVKLLDSDIPPVPGTWLLNGITNPGIVEQYLGEGNTRVFGGLLVLPTNESKTFALQMQLPSSVIEKFEDGSFTYSLKVQKQSGLNNLPMHISIRIPNGFHLKLQNLSIKYEQDQTYSWSGEITNTQSFGLMFTPDVNR